MNGEDLKDIIKEVVLDILGEFKGQIKDVVVNSIIPAVDDAIADFAAVIQMKQMAHGVQLHLVGGMLGVQGKA